VDINFSIELVTGAVPMSRTPYIMSTLEIVELKNIAKGDVGQILHLS
jgi:hypothetical protein